MTPLGFAVFGLLCFGLGAVAGGSVVYWLTTYQRVELQYYRKELAAAQDRLIYASRTEGVIIAPKTFDPVPSQPLPPELLEVVNDWESPEARAAEESRLRELYFGKGWGVGAILKERENQHP